MRLILATVVVLGLPAVAAAQSAGAVRASAPYLPPFGPPLPVISAPLPLISLPLPSITPPLPSITSPLPSITSPLTPITPFPPKGTHRPAAPGPAGNQAPRGRDVGARHGGSRKGFGAPAGVIYVVPSYGWGYYDQQPAPPPASAGYAPPAPVPAERPRGLLRLDVQADAPQQLYVDGYFVGAPGDYNGELMLEEGPHRIEIRAPGYETLVFDVRISADRVMTYRDVLKPSADRPADPAAGAPASTAPPVPSTFYLIPGCYLGNVPPADVVLPPNCDLNRLIIRTP